MFWIHSIEASINNGIPIIITKFTQTSDKRNSISIHNYTQASPTVRMIRYEIINFT